MTNTATDRGGGQVIELVAINQARAHDLLTDVKPGDPAPALLLSWHDVTAAAAQLWEALPPTTGADQLLMRRLLAVSLAIQSTLQPRERHLPADDRLLAIADTYTRAADLLHAGIEHLSPEQADRVRTVVTATIHFAAHAIRRPAMGYLTEAADRLLGIEQLTGSATGGLYEPRHDSPAVRADQAMAARIAEWEVQTFRTLARQPTTANLYVVASTEAKLGQLAATVFTARTVTARHGHDEVTARAIPPLDQATTSWRDLASEWRTMLTGDTARQLDADLVRAGQRVRRVADQLNPQRPGPADPAYALAFAIDLSRATTVTQNTLAHSAEIARATRDLTTDTNSPLRGQPHHLQDRARQLGDDRIAWVDLRNLNRGQPTPLPEPLRSHIAAICNQIADDSTRALAASAMLDAGPLRGFAARAPELHRHRRRPLPTTDTHTPTPAPRAR